MNEKRLETSVRKGSWKDGWLGAGMGLVLIAGALLSIGGAPARSTAERTSSAASAATPGPSAIADADRDVLDLQLD